MNRLSQVMMKNLRSSGPEASSFCFLPHSRHKMDACTLKSENSPVHRSVTGAVHKAVFQHEILSVDKLLG